MLLLKDLMATVLNVGTRNTLKDALRVEGMEDDFTFVMKDGSLATMILLDGAYKTPGRTEVARSAEEVRHRLSSYLSKSGHAIEFNFMRDASSARDFVTRQVNRTKGIAKHLGLSMDDVLNERVNKLSDWMVNERCLMTVYTRPGLLSKDEAKEGAAVVASETKDLPNLSGAMFRGRVIKQLFEAHQSWVGAVAGIFGERGIQQKVQVLTITQGLQEMRASLYPDTAVEKESWTPILPGWSKDKLADRPDAKRVMAMLPTAKDEMEGTNFGFLGTPTFDTQLATEDLTLHGSNTVYIGNMGFTTFDMTMAPEVLKEFNALVVDITSKDKSCPWRASFRIESGGVQSLSLKSQLLSVFLWGSRIHNNRLREAIEILQNMDGDTETVVKVRASFMTWAPNYDELRRRSQIVSGAVRRWGNAQVDGNTGAPVETTISALPGLTTASTAPAAAAPLHDALCMLPIARQASPFDDGSLLFRTPSGKPWPYLPGSTLQTTWVGAIVGTPGMGKSVLLNALAMSSALTVPSGKAELPRMVCMDVGGSLTGVADLIREALPPHRRDEVVCQTLTNTRQHCINFLDTQLGMRYPFPADLEYAKNFLKLLVSDGVHNVHENMSGLISMTIERAYERLSDQNNPKKYVPGELTDVDKALADIGYEPTASTIWYEVADRLALKGKLGLAELAQRRAVPTLQDLINISSDEQVRQMYGKVTVGNGGQTLIEAFHTALSEISRDYPMISDVTRYSIGTARVVIFEMSKVAGKDRTPAGQKRTAMMYMLAQQVGTRDFFVTEEDVNYMFDDKKAAPAFYRSYHEDRARRIRGTTKVISFDELHRCSSVPMIMNQLEQWGREGRKFGIEIRLASQLIEDFPPDLLKVLTSLVVCNVGSEDSIDVINTAFRLSDSERALLRNELKGPSAAGSNVWMALKTKRGDIRQQLYLTLGPVELWAYATDARNVTLRSMLYRKLDPAVARRVLAVRFPGGSAETEIELRLKKAVDRGEMSKNDGDGGVIEELANELVDLAYKMMQDQ